jgi:transcriptional regulator with XRE-family HTH domain
MAQGETSMDIKITVGKRIKYLRNQIGLSQEELADIAELDRTYITSVECGKRNISIVNIEKLATALNVTLKEFFDF